MKISVQVAFIAVLGASNAAYAEEFRPDKGQPFCVTERDLQAYLVAGFTKDRSIKWNCALLPSGLTVVIDEVLSNGKSSEPGFTMRVKN